MEALGIWWNKTKIELRLLSPIGGPTYFNDQTPAYFWHLEVINKNELKPAENVRVVVSAFFRKNEDGSFKKGNLPGSYQLLWCPAEEHNADPFPRLRKPRVVDFGCLVKGQDKLKPRLCWTPFNLGGFVHQGETVIYAVDIDSDNYTTIKPY